MLRHVIRTGDLSAADATAILDLARASRSGATVLDRRPIVTLVMLAPSTRTRLGFAVAAARLGGQAVVLPALRHTGEGLPPESLVDTIRVASGMSDAVVCRPAGAVDVGDLVEVAQSPLVNGGDVREHPTQALIDRFAMETLAGPIGELRVGVSGDLRSRSVRSLVQLLRLTPPRRLSLFAPPGRELEAADLPPELAGATVRPPDPDFSDLDVLFLPGLAPYPGDVPLADDAHLRWGFSPSSAGALPPGAIVLSPGPVIDEIHPALMADPRVRVFEQSDLGVAVRIGLLQWLLAEERA